MTHAESVYVASEFVGSLHISDWGTVFNPVDDRVEFASLRVITWETVEAARSVIAKTLKEKRRHG